MPRLNSPSQMFMGGTSMVEEKPSLESCLQGRTGRTMSEEQHFRVHREEELRALWKSAWVTNLWTHQHWSLVRLQKSAPHLGLGSTSQWRCLQAPSVWYWGWGRLAHPVSLSPPRADRVHMAQVLIFFRSVFPGKKLVTNGWPTLSKASALQLTVYRGGAVNKGYSVESSADF